MITSLVLILILSLLGEILLPWWSVVPAAFLGAMWKAPSGWKALGAGFAGVGGLWFCVSGYLHIRSGGILTVRIAEMFQIPSPVLLLLLTTLVGGLVGGFAASAGYHLQTYIHRYVGNEK